MNRAQALREKGNALYKRGQLTEAIKAYQEAAGRTEPNDHLPWSNLSAAYYEAGNLAESIQSALRALTICQSHDQIHGTNTSAGAEQKLVPRLIRAYLHSHNFDAARQWLDRLSGEPADAIRQCRQALAQAETLWMAFPDVGIYRARLCAEVHRYRPSLRGGQAVFSNTNLDDVTHLVDFAVQSNTERNLSVFLDGIGDARHFYAQLAILGVTERMAAYSTSALSSERKYRFILNENNSTAVGRNLVLSLLLDDLACLTDLPQAERTEIYSVLYYIFAGVIIPRYALDRLFHTIDLLIGRLQSDKPVLPWLHIDSHTDRLNIIHALESWKNSDFINRSTTVEVVNKTIQSLCDKSTYGCDEYPRAPSGCRKEFETYFKAPLLQAPRSVMREHEPELLHLLETDAPSEKLLRHVAENWFVNPTLLDGEDWQMRDTSVFGVAVSENPFNVCGALYNAVSIQERGGPRKTKLFDYASSFFQMVVVALRKIRSRLHAEYLVSHVTESIDKLRYDIDTACIAGFDLVLLSSAAGVGGNGSNNISTMVNASKILNDSQTARLMINTRRLGVANGSHEAGWTPFMAANDAEILYKTSQMQVVRTKGSPSYMLKLRRDRLSAFSYEHLLSRSDLTQFLSKEFFALALPSSSNSTASAPNLTHFFDLLIQLHDIGYPAHWLADIHAKMLGDGVNASLSPPRTPDEPTPRSITTSMSIVGLSNVYNDGSGNGSDTMAPFIPEMSTLTTMFQRVLPFNAITSGLPPPTSISQYSITFTNKNQSLSFPANDNGTGNSLMLILYNTAHAYIPAPNTAQAITLPSAEEGCVIITAFSCDHKDSDKKEEEVNVNFWMRDDLMDQILSSSSSSSSSASSLRSNPNDESCYAWLATLLERAPLSSSSSSSSSTATASETEAERETDSDCNMAHSESEPQKWISRFQAPTTPLRNGTGLTKGRGWITISENDSNSHNKYNDMMELDD